MANPAINFAGFLYDDAGDAVSGATINLYDKNTSTTSRANTTTNSSGYWTIAHTTNGEFDVQITSGSSKRRIKFDDKIHLSEVDTETLNIRGNEGAAAPMYWFADDGDDAGDRWLFNAAAGGVFTMGNDLNSQGTYVAHVTITPNATVANSTFAVAGNLTVGNALTVTGTTTLNGNLVLGDAAADTLTVGATLQGASPLTFEGGTADGYETTFAITDPTADRTITFPNLTGTVQLSGNPISGTTIDASTDFTIGDTVITDGVVTDSTGLQLAANLDIDGTADISGDLTLSAGADGALRFSVASSIKILDNSATSLVIEEADNAYMTFVTTDSSEAVSIAKTLTLSTVAAAGTDTDKFLVLDSGGNVDYRTGTQVASDIGAVTSVSATALDDIAAGDAAANLYTTVGNITIDAQANDADVIIKVDDNGSSVTAVTFDGSDEGNAIFVNDIQLKSDSAVLKFGTDLDTTLTHTDGTGLTLNSTNKLAFGDTGTFIHQSSDGVLTIESDTTVDINGAVALNGAITGATDITLSGELDAATLDLSSSADIAGDLVLSGGADGALQFTNAGENSIKIPDNQASALIIEEADNAYITFVTTNSSEAITVAKNTTFSGIVDITDATDSSDATGDTGALRTEGGASIAKKLYVGTDLDVDGIAELDNITIAGAQGNDGDVLTSTGSGVGWEAAGGGGLEEVDVWALESTAAIDGTVTGLTGMVRFAPDNDNTDIFEHIGTGMTESSGTFSFPETGKYSVYFRAQYYGSNAGGVYARISSTVNNSDYDVVSTGSNYETADKFEVTDCWAVIDVTNTTNVKIKFIAHTDAAVNINGADDILYTFAMFNKLGST
jgi:hypothetical protein